MAPGEAEFDVYCRTIWPRLVGALTLHLGDAQVAEDLAQEALALTWDRWDSVDAGRRRAWTYRVAFNRCRSVLRRRRSERRANQLYSAGQLTVGSDEVGSRAVVEAALGALTKRQREAVLARFFLGFDIEGAAEIMRCAPGTVTALTSQALARLQAAGLDRSAFELEEQRHV